MNVKIEWATPNADKAIMKMARVSNPANQHSENARLLHYCMEHGHVSPFEMASACIEINTTRDIARQILRHRSFSFQEFCISGDSMITTATNCGRIKKVSIADLYKRYQSKRYWDMSDNLVRVFDETDGLLKTAKIKEVFETGIKPVYLITLDNGRKIKSTMEHKFLVRNGFKPLSEITTDDFVASNGVVLHQDYDWLKAAKNESIQNGSGLQGIADKAGVSYHTIRKWLKKLNLGFTHKEVASYTEAWNKGLPSEDQPMFGKNHSEQTREKMADSSLKGIDSNLRSTGNNVNRSFRRAVADYWYKRKLALYNASKGVCNISGDVCDISDLEIDHIKPVSQNPELAYELSNIQLIRSDLHAKKSMSEIAIKRMTITWQKVVSITYVGNEQTYDLEVEHTSHNYVANGIVTHNSQRYADVGLLGDMVERECRLQDTKNRQNSIETNDGAVISAWDSMQKMAWIRAVSDYQLALDSGVAKEQARVLLPEGLTPSRVYMNGTMRSWVHYLKQRLDSTTQKEHRLIAAEVLEQLRTVAPITMTAFFGEPS